MSDQTFERLQAIIGREFGLPADAVTRETTAGHVDGWDSIAHASLILIIEKSFGVMFDEDEIFALPNVGALHDRLVALSARAV